MPGCCSPKRKLVIETTVLRVDGETCDRCNDTIDAARSAAEDLRKSLAPLQVDIELVEHATTVESLPDSNSVLINGTPIEEWIGAERVSTECASCGDLCGDTVCCGAVSVNGEVHESYSVAQIRDAALAALGASMRTGSCC
jgi:hypothetical protein